MSGLSHELRQKLISTLIALTPEEGYTRTWLNKVKLLRVNESMPHTPVLYEPCIVIVVQGKKTGVLGGREFVYDTQHYLVLSVPLPFTSQTVASDNEPLLALSISLDLVMIAEILFELTECDIPEAEPNSMLSTPLNEELGEAVFRLIQAASDKIAAKVLGPGLLKEIYYRVLLDVQGGTLRAALSGKGHFGQIAVALRTIHGRFQERMDVETLAKQAGMSTPAFFVHFKNFTGTTPIQYLKSTRLHQARLLMVKGGVSAAEASIKVGYESPTQFSREFKHFFGHPPLKEAQRLRELLKVKAESYWPD